MFVGIFRKRCIFIDRVFLSRKGLEGSFSRDGKLVREGSNFFKVIGLV